MERVAMPLISVVIPVYNAQSYLERCFRSLEHQTVSDLEVILVDDGSTDSSLPLARDQARRDSRFRALARPHQGQSAARNAGLGEAAGEYVFFMDADDELPPGALEALLRGRERSGADLVLGDYRWFFYDGRGTVATWRDRERLVSGADALEDIFVDFLGNIKNMRNFYTVWGKLYRRDLLNERNIRFDETLAAAEDNLFVFQYLAACRSILYIKDVVYIYYHRDNSFASARLYQNHTFDFKKPYAFLCGHLLSRGHPRALALHGNALAEQALVGSFHITRRANWLSFRSLAEARQKIARLWADEEIHRGLLYYRATVDDNFFFIPGLAAKRQIRRLMLAFKLQIMLKAFFKPAGKESRP